MKSRIIAVSSAAIALVLSAPAWGEEANDQDPDNEILVTARRTAESAQSVPISITAFSQDTLRQQNITSAQQLDKAVPGLLVTTTSGNPGNIAFSIRGRGQNFGTPAGAVEVYFADVPVSGPPNSVTLPPQFFDIGSFQVLKGPQGTLFGRSTTGGAIVIVPQAPRREFGGYGRVQVGNYRNVQLEGAINAPLGDIGALRLAGFHWQRRGYGKTFAGNRDLLTGKILGVQRYNNRDITELRGTLLLEPSDKFSNTTIVTYHYDRNVSSAGAGLQITPADRLTPTGSTKSHGFGTHWSDSDIEFGRMAPSKVLALVNTSTLKVNDSLTLKNIFGLIDSQGNFTQGTNADGTALASVSLPSSFRPIKTRQYTNEFQIQGGSLNDRLKWVMGGLIDLTRQPRNPSNINIATVLRVGSCGIDCNNIRTLYGGWRYNSYGAFASGTFDITPALSVTAGYRKSWDKVQLVSGAVVAPVQQTPDARPSLAPATLQLQSRSFRGDVYNADIVYRAGADTMIYGGYRRGYKRGGFNASTVDVNRASFGPETVDNFYLGAKTSFDIAGRPARFNVEAYHDNYHGQHATYSAFSNGVISSITTNIDRSTFTGFDVEFSADVQPWLTLRGTYGYLDAKVKRWVDRSIAGSTVDLTRNPVPYASKHKLTSSARLHFDSPSGEMALMPTLSYQSVSYSNPACHVLPLGAQNIFGNFDSIARGGCTIPARTLVDLRAEWNHIAGTNISAAINAENLTNRVYRTGTNSTLQIGVEGDAYGPPRMVTFEVSVKF